MCAHRHITENRGIGRTHDIWMIETLEHLHLAPYALLIPLGMAFSATSCMTTLGTSWVEGLHVAMKECGVVGRESDEVEGEGEDKLAGQCSVRVHYPGGTCHVTHCHM